METDTLRVRAYELGALGLLATALSRIFHRTGNDPQSNVGFESMNYKAYRCSIGF